jgi:hypothetical protein
MKELTPDKWKVINHVASILQIPAHYLATVIAFETAETFDPRIRNPHSRAVGLIQFTTVGLSSISSLKLTLEKIAEMSFHAQMYGPVYFYLKENNARGLTKLSDLYMTILAPSARIKPMDHDLYKSPSRAYTQNKGLDKNKDGVIEKWEASQAVYAKLPRVVERILSFEKE